MTAAVDLYFKLLKVIVAALLASTVVMVFGNVVLRYAFNSGISFSEELSRWCFVWITFIGAVVALHERQHLGMDFVVKRLSRAGKKFCLVLSHVLMLYATWLILWGSWRQTLLNYEVPAPVTGLSTGYFYGIGVFFGVSSGIILLNDLYKVVTGTISEEELITVKESEEGADLGGPGKPDHEPLAGAGRG